MPLKRLRDFLDSQHIAYISISHSVAYTAQGVAAVTHIPGKELAKTVIVNLDGSPVMAVVPAQSHVDLRLLREAAGAKQADLETEPEFKGKFPDCETGAMPPFGNLYGMKVFVDVRLTLDKEIAFNAGSHREIIRMSWKDYVALVKPVVTNLTTRAVEKVA
jgi:Ala-tRNA(Pro) deacylase